MVASTVELVGFRILIFVVGIDVLRVLERLYRLCILNPTYIVRITITVDMTMIVISGIPSSPPFDVDGLTAGKALTTALSMARVSIPVDVDDDITFVRST